MAQSAIDERGKRLFKFLHFFTDNTLVGFQNVLNGYLPCPKLFFSLEVTKRKEVVANFLRALENYTPILVKRVRQNSSS